MKYMIFSLFYLISVAAKASGSTTWPQVRGADVSVKFSSQYDSFKLQIPILSDSGTKLYWLYCIGGKDKYLDSFYDQFGLNYVGPLSCGISNTQNINEMTWLSEDASPLWHSRGQFHYPELLGSCAVYPEFGAVRNFKLRGMQITLSISDIQEVGGMIDSFLLTATVKNDPTALTAKAERSGYLSPRLTEDGVRDCDTILEGKEPLMCRNSETFSWEECPKGWEYERCPWEDDDE